MTCLSDGSCCCASLLSEEVMSRRLSLKEPEQSASAAASNGFFLAEKVFPVYAMGISRPELGQGGSALDSGDPIWEAVREDAKLEICGGSIHLGGGSFLIKSLLANLVRYGIL
ncbi:hypothetical protein CRG98_012291 [Punica granatum]|uniref:Uncharacterized protein n=1 Tax=Punica granatum TaxID=22663 RepID=A0A2I0KFQ8_PUNGR|nr:hypothetical protein CRG98_012291 [Punica granatum]